METKEPLNIDEVHAGTLKIVEKLSSICDMLHIDYFVAYGSLIGAIRHKGFIPWDDDFDVIMLRPDYDKFVNYCYKHEKELYPFKILNREVSKKYPYTISRFEDMRYKAVYDNIVDYDSGMFVDVYPYDGAGTDEIAARKKIGWKKDILAKCVGWAIRNEYTRPENQSAIVAVLKYIGFKVVHLIGKDFFLNQYEKLSNTYSFEDSTLVGCLCWGGGLYVLDKKLFEKSITVPFENIMVKIPAQYDEILKRSYVDYMKLPPKEERVATHEYTLYKR